MASKAKSAAKAPRWYRGTNVPMRLIRKFARDVAEKFHPEKIILFGSHAYGTPHEDSDVDILVVMPCRNQLDQAVKIELACDPPFPLDLVVRAPTNIQWRLEEGDLFHTEVVTKGKVLYAKGNARMGPQGRKGLSLRRGDSVPRRQRHQAPGRGRDPLGHARAP